uniref:PDZ domain-containing protein n=1 Tax=Skeletonema marinoi TaxID=267567 RepID=A0A7S2KJ43_9STRA|mmetsp:Transcript_1328/g.2190  ORF Transcript_1328/g.2190 Transcript_1328/m.2190 type:complete len:914 (+) Transcript_1328:57-2798(+)
MVLATKSMGLNPDVLSFAYADMSSVSSPRRPPKNISLGTERLVQLYSSDPEDLGIEIEHSDDGYVRIASTAGDGMFEGTVHAGDIVCEIAGVNMRRPITEHMWRLTTGLMKVAPKPIEVIVAEEHASQEGAAETLGAVVNVPEKNADAENTQSPSLVKQAMSMWQNLNLNGASKEEYHDSPGNGTSDTASMSDGNEGSTIQVHDPYSDPERFGMERNIIFHTESLGVKLHRCPNEGIVQILHVEQSVSENIRGGDDNGRLEVGDVIVEVGGVDLRHKFIGPLEWADMVYFVQNVGRPLDIVVVEDNHCVRERGGDSGAMYNMEQEVEEDAKDEGEVENTDETEASDHDMSVEEDGDLEAEDEDDDVNEAVDQESSNGAEIEEEEEDLEINVEVDVEVNEDVDEEVEQGISNESVAVAEAADDTVLELDDTLEEEIDEDLQIDDECYEQDDKSEHQQEETKEVEKSEEAPVMMTPVEQEDESSDEEPEDVMVTLVEQFVATREKEASFPLPVEEEPVQEVEIERTRQQIEEELSQLPKFSPEWFLLKSELVELRVSELILDENKQASDTGSQKSFVHADNVTLKASKDASGAETEQKRPTSSFYFRTHPNIKSSHVAVSSVSEVPSQMKDAESSVVSRETVTTSESSEDPPLTPTTIIEEDDVFEVTMWAGPKVNKSKEDTEAAFSSTFGHDIFSMDDSDTEEPFTGGINFDAPPRVAASALFSHAFIVNRGGDVGSPLFVVKKTLPNQNNTNKPQGYLQMETPREQVQDSKIPNTKPALDMSQIALHQDMSLESALSAESAWDTADFANEADAQADNFFLDILCGDSMCQGLINDSSDMRQMKEKAVKPRKKRLFGKLRKKKRKDDAKMLGYGSLEDDTEDYRSATAAFAPQKVTGKMANFSGFQPLDDEIDL